MPAKLSPEQKALNKEATKLRDRAYNARKRAHRVELEAAQQAIDSGPAAQAAREADQAFEVALAAKSTAVAEVEAQIKALAAKLEETKQAHDALIAPLRAARSAAWDGKRKAQQEAEATVAAKYPDVAHVWSAAGWKSFEEFLPQVTAKP